MLKNFNFDLWWPKPSQKVKNYPKTPQKWWKTWKILKKFFNFWNFFSKNKNIFFLKSRFLVDFTPEILVSMGIPSLYGDTPPYCRMWIKKYLVVFTNTCYQTTLFFNGVLHLVSRFVCANRKSADPLCRSLASTWHSPWIRHRRTNRKSKCVWERIHLISNYRWYTIYKLGEEKP